MNAQKNIKNIITLLFAVFFILLNVNASNLIPETESNEMKYPDPKSAVCSAIGCKGGDRICGTASATLSLEIEGVGGSVEVEYTCYEATPQ